MLPPKLLSARILRSSGVAVVLSCVVAVIACLSEEADVPEMKPEAVVETVTVFVESEATKRARSQPEAASPTEGSVALLGRFPNTSCVRYPNKVAVKQKVVAAMRIGVFVGPGETYEMLRRLDACESVSVLQECKREDRDDWTWYQIRDEEAPQDSAGVWIVGTLTVKECGDWPAYILEQERFSALAETQRRSRSRPTSGGTLSLSERKAVYRALVAMQDELYCAGYGVSLDANVYGPVARIFGISEAQAKQIAAEGTREMWPVPESPC